MDFDFDRTCSFEDDERTCLFEDDKEAGGAGLEVREGVEAGKGRSGGSRLSDSCFRDFVFASFGGVVSVILGILYFCANFFFHISSGRLVIPGFVRLVLLSLAFVAVVFAVFSFVALRIRFPFRVSDTAGLLLFIVAKGLHFAGSWIGSGNELIFEIFSFVLYGIAFALGVRALHACCFPGRKPGCFLSNSGFFCGAFFQLMVFLSAFYALFFVLAAVM